MTIYLAGLHDRPNYPGTYYNIARSKFMPTKKEPYYPQITCLAPLLCMVQDHQVGLLDDELYIARYKELMRERTKELAKLFRSLKPEENQVWLCFCKEYETETHEMYEIKKFCHRHLVAGMLRKYRPDIPIEVH